MKSLELTTHKRLLIVEPPKNYSLVHFKYGDTRLGFVNLDKANPYDDVIDFTIGEHLHTICSGSDLTEEIAAGMVDQSIHTGLYAHYVKGMPVNTYCYKKALTSFISAIEAAGYYWTNPLADEISAPDIDEWQEAEARTLHPERCIIFEIVEGQS